MSQINEANIPDKILQPSNNQTAPSNPPDLLLNSSNQIKNPSKELTLEQMIMAKDYNSTSLNSFKNDIMNLIRIKSEESQYLFKTYKELLKNYQGEFEESKTNLTDNLKNIISSQAQINHRLQKLDSYEEANTATKEKITSHEIRINNLRNELSNAMLKYDKIYIDNLELPGIINKFSKFKNCREFFDFVIKDLNRLNQYKEKNTLDFKSYKEKLETIIKSFNTLVENNNKSQVKIINEKSDFILNECTKMMNELGERLNEMRVENSKYAIDLLAKSVDLSKEWDVVLKIKEEIFHKFDISVKEYRESNNDMIKNFDDFKEEYVIIKKKFWELAEFIKDVRFRKNIGALGINKDDNGTNSNNNNLGNINYSNNNKKSDNNKKENAKPANFIVKKKEAKIIAKKITNTKYWKNKMNNSNINMDVDSCKLIENVDMIVKDPRNEYDDEKLNNNLNKKKNNNINNINNNGFNPNCKSEKGSPKNQNITISYNNKNISDSTSNNNNLIRMKTFIDRNSYTNNNNDNNDQNDNKQNTLSRSLGTKSVKSFKGNKMNKSLSIEERHNKKRHQENKEKETNTQENEEEVASSKRIKNIKSKEIKDNNTKLSNKIGRHLNQLKAHRGIKKHNSLNENYKTNLTSFSSPHNDDLISVASENNLNDNITCNTSIVSLPKIVINNNPNKNNIDLNNKKNVIKELASELEQSNTKNKKLENKFNENKLKNIKDNLIPCLFDDNKKIDEDDIDQKSEHLGSAKKDLSSIQTYRINKDNKDNEDDKNILNTPLNENKEYFDYNKIKEKASTGNIENTKTKFTLNVTNDDTKYSKIKSYNMHDNNEAYYTASTIERNNKTDNFTINTQSQNNFKFSSDRQCSDKLNNNNNNFNSENLPNIFNVDDLTTNRTNDNCNEKINKNNDNKYNEDIHNLALEHSENKRINKDNINNIKIFPQNLKENQNDNNDNNENNDNNNINNNIDNNIDNDNDNNKDINNNFNEIKNKTGNNFYNKMGNKNNLDNNKNNSVNKNKASRNDHEKNRKDTKINKFELKTDNANNSKSVSKENKKETFHDRNVKSLNHLNCGTDRSDNSFNLAQQTSNMNCVHNEHKSLNKNAHSNSQHSLMEIAPKTFTTHTTKIGQKIIGLNAQIVPLNNSKNACFGVFAPSFNNRLIIQSNLNGKLKDIDGLNNANNTTNYAYSSFVGNPVKRKPFKKQTLEAVNHKFNFTNIYSTLGSSITDNKENNVNASNINLKFCGNINNTCDQFNIKKLTLNSNSFNCTNINRSNNRNNNSNNGFKNFNRTSLSNYNYIDLYKEPSNTFVKLSCVIDHQPTIINKIENVIDNNPIIDGMKD